MNGTQRRENILALLKKSPNAFSGTALGEELGVSPLEVTKCGGASKLLVGTLTQIAKEARPDEN